MKQDASSTALIDYNTIYSANLCFGGLRTTDSIECLANMIDALIVFDDLVLPAVNGGATPELLFMQESGVLRFADMDSGEIGGFIKKLALSLSVDELQNFVSVFLDKTILPFENNETYYAAIFGCNSISS